MTWTRATIIAVTLALCAACAQPAASPHPIRDKIDRDARLG
jgi:hypothetical protein